MSDLTREQYAAMHTVADLRDMLKSYYEITAPSKTRKAELIELLFEARAKRQAEIERDNMNLAGALYMASTEGAVPTVEEWRQLNHAKYLGRYHAKRVQIRSMGRFVAGRVIEDVYREAELLLVVEHDRQAELRHGKWQWSDATSQFPRRTLHRAEDVKLSA